MPRSRPHESPHHYHLRLHDRKGPGYPDVAVDSWVEAIALIRHTFHVAELVVESSRPDADSSTQSLPRQSQQQHPTLPHRSSSAQHHGWSKPMSSQPTRLLCRPGLGIRAGRPSTPILSRQPSRRRRTHHRRSRQPPRGDSHDQWCPRRSNGAVPTGDGRGGHERRSAYDR